MREITAEAIRAEVEKRKPEIVEWTKNLVRFPSENRPPRGNEREAQSFVREQCKKLGWETDLFRPDDIPGIETHPSWLAGRDYEGRENVVAAWKGSGGGRSILFSGHMDVAPFEPDSWQVCRPFDPVMKDGRLYGRGTADMKGGLAAAYWALRILREMDFEPEGDLLFESVVDEEFAGGNGTLASRVRGHNADCAILMEPTRMEVCPACLGAFLGDLTLSGKAGMPYMGEAIPNPVFGAAAAIRLFKEWQDLWREQNSHPLFEQEGKELNVLLWRIDSTKPGEFTQMGTPLLTKISWVVWCYPGMTEKEFYRRFRSFWEKKMEETEELSSFSLEIRPDYHYVRPWETEADDSAIVQVVDSFREYSGKTPSVGGAPFSCDFALYGDEGNMPCMILGPRGDNLHAPDEWVLFEDVLDLTGIFALCAVRWCTRTY
jgi:acetylornithine deacetylase